MKDDFNKETPIRPITPQKDVSEKELFDRIENISKVAPSNQLRFETLSYRHVYFEQMRIWESSRTQRDMNFIDGQQVGLHQNYSLDNMHQQEAERQQRHRDGVMTEVKTHYHQNYSLSRSFRQVSIQKDKPKEMERD